MTDASSVGSWTKPAEFYGTDHAVSFQVWQKIADKFPGKFGNPKPFYLKPLETVWQSFTVTMKNKELFKMFTDL